MRLQELNACRSDVDIPFSKVGMCKHKQIYNVRETEGYTAQQYREETHSFPDVMPAVNFDTLHDVLLKACNIEEF